MMVRFFEDSFPYNLIIKPAPVRLVSIVVFIGLLGPAIWGASQLEAQTSPENFLPDSHPFQRFINMANNFNSSSEDDTVPIQVIWGVDTVSPIKDGTNRLFKPDQQEWGNPNYVSTFNLDVDAQQAILDTCDLLDTAKNGAGSDDYAVMRTYDAVTGNTTTGVKCFMRNFQSYRESKALPFPVTGSHAAVSAALLAWLEDSLHSGPNSGYRFEGDIGWAPDASNSNALTLVWAKVQADSLLPIRAYLPAKDLRVHYDVWVDILEDVNAITPKGGLGQAMQIAGLEGNSRRNKWLHMILQETYVQMAITGVGIGLAIAAVVLLLATMNVIMATLCVLTIIACLCCVLGTIVAMGWQLGSAESLSMMILTGFAVDYVVHLAHSYMESDDPTRLGRVHDALRDMGISVFWGMLTSFIAAVVLSSLQLQFFSKFGIFFLLTIIYAYFWAVLFLMPMLAFVGPEGGGGVKTTDSIEPGGASTTSSDYGKDSVPA